MPVHGAHPTRHSAEQMEQLRRGKSRKVGELPSQTEMIQLSTAQYLLDLIVVITVVLTGKTPSIHHHPFWR